ncbi:MAG TPA: succinate dehydrogenase, cytochrome b556 subunit [Casimicrobiaceae bacterium]|jgi:fumarate reductase subunit D
MARAGVHGHPAWWAYLAHRLSGLALAIFLPVHFWALGTALAGPAALDSFLRFAEQPLVRFAQWGLVVLLVVHLTGGVRLLLIEFRPWSGLRHDWIAGTVGAGAMIALVYALALLG